MCSWVLACSRAMLLTVISHRDAKALKEASQEFSRATLEDVAKWKQTNKHCGMVLDGCQVLVTKSGGSKKMHARVLQYLVELLKFYNYTKRNRFIKKSEVQETLKSVAEEVVGSMMDKFVLTDSSGQRTAVSSRG
eukprot:m.46525 g.46525  ORF g.46525 m.46525 type:complete len:135 (-) comp13156_c0_seq8:492-896(-)